MFYSRQLLARKAPLGQIWRAATTHMKIHRRKLNKINIIKICEEILNPSVPMALRLSGILMGGVVLVYEQKVKLLHDDVNSLMIEINKAWKVKVVADPTLLPKGRTQARKEAITLPENQDTDIGDIEQSLNFSVGTATMRFQQTTYFAMELDSVDEAFITGGAREEDPSDRFHQAEPEDITLAEPFDLNQDDATAYNRYERFDVGLEDEVLFNASETVHHSLAPSPPRPHVEPQMEPQVAASEIQEENREEHVNQRSEINEVGVVRRRKTRRREACLMDEEHTVVPAHVYQAWLQDASDTVSRRHGRKRKRTKITLTTKIGTLMELPSVVLMDGSFKTGNREVYYPATLMEFWRQKVQHSPSARTSSPFPRGSPVFPSPRRPNSQDPTSMNFEDFQSGVGSQSLNMNMNMNMDTDMDMDMPETERQRDPFIEISADLLANLRRDVLGAYDEPNPMVTPRNPVTGNDGIPSAGSAPQDFSAGRSDKKRPYSSSRHSGSSLKTVPEENPDSEYEPNFQLGRLSENNGLTPEQELIVETGVTQTQKPVMNTQLDQITDCIRMQLKGHFETPGAPKDESLNNLAFGMNRKGASLLFYQTCVLASRDVLKVDQRFPYGDILISKGAKM